MEIYSHPYRRTTGRLSVTLNRRANDNYELIVDTLKDAPGTLYRLCAVLFRHDWDVQNAEICTMENLQVVDRFLISPASREEVDEIKFEEMMKDFEHLLFENLDVSAYVAGRQGEIRATPGAGEPTGTADVRYTKESNRGHLILIGQDRPGLLLDIAGVFAQREIDILEAQIETTAEGQARNDFLINPTDTRFEDAEFRAQLERELRPLL